MKKLFTSLKFLLVAVCLLGGGNYALAGVSNIFSQGSWVHTHDGGNGARSAYLDFGVNSSIDGNWEASFDVTTTTGSTWTQASDFQIALTKDGTSYTNNTLANNSYVLLGARIATTKANIGTDLACTITLNGEDVEGTTTLSHGTKYTFIISVDGTSLTASIMNGSTTVYSGNATLDAFVKPRGVYSLLPRPYNASWGVYTNTFDNVLVTKEVTAEEVSIPSIAVAYAGANRTVTITPGASSESNAVTTYYTLDGTDPTSSSNVYTAPLDIDADCTVKAITISSSSVASSIVSQAVTVGTLKLATPTLAMTGYSNGTYTVTMTSNQAGLAYPPASTTLYYSIDGGAATEYTSPFGVEAGSSVTAYVSATNYTNSDEAYLATAIRPALIDEWSIDFVSQATVDKGGVTVGGKAFDATGVDFSNISGDFTSNDNFGVKTGSSWLLRNTGSKGLYSFNGSGTPVGVSNLTMGQYVKIVVGGMTNCTVSGAASLVDDMSTTTELYIVANEDGNACIDFNRYVYIQSISVCRVITGIKPGLGTNGYATFACDYALDLRKANLPAGITAAYKAAVDGNTVRFTELDQTVPAYTGVLLEGNPDAATLDLMIPVVPSGDVVTDNAFEVNTAGTYFTPEDGYTYYGLLKNTLTFRPFDPLTVVIPAYKAYLKVESASPVHGLDVTFEGTDGIETLRNVESETMSNAMFDLSGRRVAKAQKGIYIVNGKKVVK